jgi:hypothetical protein
MSSDPTIDSFYIELDNPDDFALFGSLVDTGVTVLCPERYRAYLMIGRQLGNDELIDKLYGLHQIPTELNTANVVSELQFCEMFERFWDGLLAYAAEHFSEIREQLECQMNLCTLDAILSRDLILDSEDALFDFIRHEIEKRGDTFQELLSRVDLRCLSPQKMLEFMNVVDLRRIDGGIWERIRERLLLPVFHPLRRSVVSEYPRLIGPGSDYFNGIFAELNRQTGGNCAVNGGIVATASNTYYGTLTILFNKSDWGQSSCWQHQNVKDGWFQVDFKSRRLVMTHYAIHNSVYWVREYDFLKTWTVEGSHDEKVWSVIDRRTNDETLHGKDKIQALFRCNGDTQQAFRFIRLYQRGASHDSSFFYFCISQFEVFGLLYE